MILFKPIEISLNQKITTKKDMPLIQKIPAQSTGIKILGVL